MNGEIFLISGLILLAIFLVAFILGVKRTVRNNKKIRNVLDKARVFADMVNQGTVYYSCYKSVNRLINEKGNWVKILDGVVDCEMIYPAITLGSKVPSKAYRIAIQSVGYRKNLPNQTGTVMQFHIRPERVKTLDWTVVKYNDTRVVVKHSIMGILELNYDRNRTHYQIGQRLALMQDVSRIEHCAGYHLNYRIIQD